MGGTACAAGELFLYAGSVVGSRLYASSDDRWISITFYYLFLHTNQNNRDPLTSALTRRRLYLDAERYRTALTAVISLDLNNLKALNDKYGHVAGDQALDHACQLADDAMYENKLKMKTTDIQS